LGREVGRGEALREDGVHLEVDGSFFGLVFTARLRRFLAHEENWREPPAAFFHRDFSSEEQRTWAWVSLGIVLTSSEELINVMTLHHELSLLQHPIREKI